MLNITINEAENMLKKSGHLIRFFNNNLRNNRHLALLAVKKDGLSLYHIKHFNSDKEICFEAIKNNYFAIEHISDELKNDTSFIEKILELDSKLSLFFNFKKMSKVSRHLSINKNENFTKTYNK